MQTHHILTTLLFVTALAAQGQLLPNGDFSLGTSGWSNLRFDDPIGGTGAVLADVSGAGVSPCLQADFVSPSLTSSCLWISDPQPLPAGSFAFSYDVMWQKAPGSAVGDPSGNYLEVNIIDSSEQRAFQSHLPMTRVAAAVDRRSLSGTAVIPTAGSYRVYVIMQHDAGANLAYSLSVDNIVLGPPWWTHFGSGCDGAGGCVPDIAASGAPTLGSTDWKLRLSGAKAPSLAALTLGFSRTSWRGMPLPLPLGGGCMLLVPPDANVFALTTGGVCSGAAAVSLPLPTAPSWHGVSLFSQWLVLDPASSSPLGVSSTRGLAFTLD